MSQVELAAQRRADRDLKPLDRTALLVAPVLTPVIFAAAAGIAVGALVGYVDRARHGGAEVRALHDEQLSNSGELDNLAVAELLQTRQDALAG